MIKTQKVSWWRTGSANAEGKLGKEPDGEMGSESICHLNSEQLSGLCNIDRLSDYVGPCQLGLCTGWLMHRFSTDP